VGLRVVLGAAGGHRLDALDGSGAEREDFGGRDQGAAYSAARDEKDVHMLLRNPLYIGRITSAAAASSSM
jgi:hypothetical protein